MACAAALQQRYPQLHLAVLCYGDPDDQFTERRVICHDQQFAYDAAGRLPLADATGGAHAELG